MFFTICVTCRILFSIMIRRKNDLHALQLSALFLRSKWKFYISVQILGVPKFKND